MNRRKKKCQGSSCYFLNWPALPLLWASTEHAWASFPLLPFPSEMSQRHPGTRMISVDLGIREGFLSSCPSCLWKKGWKLPMRSHHRVCDLCSHCSPIRILVALSVLTKNAGIYEPSSLDPFGWIYQHSLMLLIKEKNLFLGRMTTEDWNRTLPRCCNSARVS